MNFKNFYIMGSARSGTTLFRLMLNSHSSITVPPECGFSLWLYDKYEKFTRDSISQFCKDVFESKKFETWDIGLSMLTEYLLDKQPTSYREACNLVYLLYASKEGKTPIWIGEKNNYYVSHFDELKKSDPSANYIIIVRDVRDVICSYRDLNRKKVKSKHAPSLPTTLKGMIDKWRGDNEFLLMHKPKDALLIRYEDLINNPVSTLQKASNALGLDFEMGMLDYYLENDEPKDFMEWKENTFKPISNTSIGRYKNDLDSNEIKIIEKECGSLLKQFGYIL